MLRRTPLEAGEGLSERRDGAGDVRGADVRAVRGAVPGVESGGEVLLAGVPDEGRGCPPSREATARAGAGGLTMEDREFWREVRRWLKTRILADQQMVKAIEARFGFEDRKLREKPPHRAA